MQCVCVCVYVWLGVCDRSVKSHISFVSNVCCSRSFWLYEECRRRSMHHCLKLQSTPKLTYPLIPINDFSSTSLLSKAVVFRPRPASFFISIPTFRMKSEQEKGIGAVKSNRDDETYVYRRNHRVRDRCILKRSWPQEGKGTGYWLWGKLMNSIKKTNQTGLHWQDFVNGCRPITSLENGRKQLGMTNQQKPPQTM